jgi:hypothetical protein
VIEEFADSFQRNQELEGAYKFGDKLEPGQYRFDGKQVADPL